MDTVLIVDDIAENIETLTSILRGAYKTKAAINGSTALKIAAKDSKPDIILLDIMMPDMDGFEVIEKLKASTDTMDIPVIFVTALGETKDEAKGLELGAVDYLVKPLNPLLVLKRIETHLELYKHKKSLMDMVEEKSKELVELNRNLEKQVLEKTEENLRKNEIIQAQARFAQMGELLHMIAHQWRQPLNHISIVMQMYEDCPEGERAVLLEKVMTSVTRLSDTVSNFIDFFKPEDSKCDVCIQTITTDALALMQEDLNSQNVCVTTSLNNDIDLVRTYPASVKEVILKLLQNAFEALVKNSVDKPEISISISSLEEGFCLKIVDNGGGIESDMLDKVFDPYFSTKDVLQNKGMGLYSAKTMIESYCNGSLTIENNGNGVTASVYLPLSV